MHTTDYIEELDHTIELTADQLLAIVEQVALPETVGEAGKEKLEGVIVFRQNPADRDMLTVEEKEGDTLATVDIVPPHINI